MDFPPSKKNLKLVFLVNHIEFLISHRIDLVNSAVDRGYVVKIICGQSESIEMANLTNIKKLNEAVEIYKIPLRSRSTSLFFEILALYKIFLNLRKISPDICHFISTKAVIYGGIASCFLNIKSRVFSISGMGYLFTGNSNSIYQRLIKIIYKLILRVVFLGGGIKVIVQNSEDLSIFKKICSDSKVTLIEGSGVELKHIKNIAIGDKKKIVLFPARVLKEKGILDFLAAAANLKNAYADWLFFVAGAMDYGLNNVFQTHIKQNLSNDGNVRFLGHVEDIYTLYRDASIVCLPSYREGFSKSLIEALAHQCAIVTSNVPGCRDAITPGISGILVSPKDPLGISAALSYLIDHDSIRNQMGINGNKIAFSKHSVNKVVEKNLKVYEEIER